MTNIFAIYRNSYLQTRSSNVNPRIINRSVDLARGKPIIGDCSYFEPPWFRVTSEQPDIPSENTDPITRSEAFGAWALPKLMRQLHDDDSLVVNQALLSLCDLARDPEKGYEAINLKIPDRLADCLLDPLPPVREGAALLLTILAELEQGKEAIIQNASLLENLCYGLGDSQISVRMKVAGCFELVARSWTAADVLVEAELIQKLLEIVEKGELPEIVELHLQTLHSLMYECGKCVALKNNGFRIFMQYLNHELASISCKALDCLALLTSTKKGKKLALKMNLLKTLNKLLQYGNSEIYASAASVVMFCTVKTRAKYVTAEMKYLVRRLLTLSTNPLNRSLQMFCLKALTNICEHPLVRKEMRDHHFEELTKLQVDPDNAEYKRILLTIVGWVPQRSQ